MARFVTLVSFSFFRYVIFRFFFFRCVFFRFFFFRYVFFRFLFSRGFFRYVSFLFRFFCRCFFRFSASSSVVNIDRVSLTYNKIVTIELQSIKITCFLASSFNCFFPTSHWHLSRLGLPRLRGSLFRAVVEGV